MSDNPWNEEEGQASSASDKSKTESTNASAIDADSKLGHALDNAKQDDGQQERVEA